MADRRRRLARRRKVLGYTQEQLAEQLGVDRTTVSRWEAGETEPHAWQRPNIADVLDVSTDELAALLGTTKDEQPGVAPHGQGGAGDDESDSVKRREVLAVGSAAVVEAVLAAPTRVSQALNVVTADSADDVGIAADSLEELISHYSQTVGRLSPTDVYDDLLSVRSCAGSLLGRATSARRRSDLVVAAGWLSNLLAVTTSYLGDHAAALVWCSDAERRGREAGHAELAGWATLHQATIAYYQGQARRSVTLTRRGQKIASVGTVPYAKLAAQEMRALAMLGDTEGMAQAKRSAAEAIAKLPSDAPTTGVFSIALAEEPPYTATSLLLAKRFAAAVSATNRVIETVHRPSAGGRVEQPSNYARSLLILALAHAGLGHVNDAAHAGQAALNSAGLVWPTMVLANQLDRTLTRNFADTTAAADYHACHMETPRRTGPLPAAHLLAEGP